ncbi:MAG: selenide, water dikinase SelD [Bacteroidales bacterium]|nr:selenide, water dikinase SelD [Bacteroidales bacterium]
MEPVYLDYNATTPVAPEVAEAMRPYIDKFFGNPSSLHSFGTATKIAVENSRRQVAGLLDCDPDEIVFTSGGTESNNYAIKGIAFGHKKKGKHIITSAIEHPAVYEVCKYLEDHGFELTYLPVDSYGMVDPSSVSDSIKDNTILITVMHANNEVGTIQPIEEISVIAKEHGIIFHTDAAQSAGKIPTRVKDLGVDLLSIAGHKLYAPKGIGALYIKNGTSLEKLIHGADHERNMRAGTENVLEIVGLGKACEMAAKNLPEYQKHYRENRDRLLELLEDAVPGLRVNNHKEKCLPNTLSISFPGLEANTLISRLENVAASAGAACHAESIDVSQVLEAMKIPVRYAMGTIRFSTGRYNKPGEMELAAKEIAETVSSLRPRDEKNLSSAEESAVSADKIKLTHYTHGLGCACKIQPQNLEKVLEGMQTFSHPDVLVGTETSDDAGVYRINDKQAIVQTLDFFTPVVDNPYHFGAIAASNALSDIYAMGAKPLFALNIVGFPEDTLPLEVLKQILQGASDKAAEAGIPILGGHTIEDPEPKFGLVVSGITHPGKILRNSGAEPGDSIILTKAIGTGILSTALKRGLLDNDLQDLLISTMTELNKLPAELMQKYNVHACTDVTGFGLAGHLREMTRGSACDAEVKVDDLPLIRETRNLAAGGIIPGGTYNNHKFVKDDVNYGRLGKTMQLVLCDAQTSGGLLISMPREEARSFIEELHAHNLPDASIIGTFIKKGKGRISFL